MRSVHTQLHFHTSTLSFYHIPSTCHFRTHVRSVINVSNVEINKGCMLNKPLKTENVSLLQHARGRRSAPDRAAGESASSAARMRNWPMAGENVATGYHLQFCVRPPRFHSVVNMVVRGKATDVLKEEVRTLQSKGVIRMVPST